MPDQPLEIEVYHDKDNVLSTDVRQALDYYIEQWLEAKAGKSGSDKTLTAYRDNMQLFRAALQAMGHDLDSDARVIATVAA